MGIDQDLDRRGCLTLGMKLGDEVFLALPSGEWVDVLFTLNRCGGYRLVIRAPATRQSG